MSERLLLVGLDADTIVSVGSRILVSSSRLSALTGYRACLAVRGKSRCGKLVATLWQAFNVTKPNKQ
jgi:hypothetical protein